MNTNHSVSVGKLWQLFIVGKNVRVFRFNHHLHVMMSSDDISCDAGMYIVHCACQMWDSFSCTVNVFFPNESARI